eukprot:m.449484 g.449484  ORF g.449484 m.449484 type:complete len:164 (+) comp56900_c0_seq24:16-507(+)
MAQRTTTTPLHTQVHAQHSDLQAGLQAELQAEFERGRAGGMGKTYTLSKHEHQRSEFLCYGVMAHGGRVQRAKVEPLPDCVLRLAKTLETLSCREGAPHCTSPVNACSVDFLQPNQCIFPSLLTSNVRSRCSLVFLLPQFLIFLPFPRARSRAMSSWRVWVGQ